VDVQLSSTSLVDHISEQLRLLRLEQGFGLASSMSQTNASGVYGSYYQEFDHSKNNKPEFIRGLSQCPTRPHILLPNGVYVCFEGEYRLAVHARINNNPLVTETPPTSKENNCNSCESSAHVPHSVDEGRNVPHQPAKCYLRTYYMKYHPQGVSMELLQPRFVHPGPEHPQDSDLIILNSLNTSSSSPGNSHSVDNATSTTSDAFSKGNPNRNSFKPSSSTATTPTATSTLPSVTPRTPSQYVVKKLQPISPDPKYQPHTVVIDYWQKHSCSPKLPWWLRHSFKYCHSTPLKPIELYRGLDHYYVWYPLELTSAAQYKTHSIYCLIVNRVHWIEQLFEEQRREPTLPRYIIQCLMRIQDQHHFLQLLMCETNWFSDEQLLCPVESLTSQKHSESSPPSTTSTEPPTSQDDLLGKWQALRQVRENMIRDGRWDASQIPMNVNQTTILDMYMPSYDFVFHEGELPDLTLLLILIMMFSTSNRADRPVQITNEILPLMNLMWKALLMPMKLRDHTRASSEKTQDSQTTFECQLRMVMAFYGGYYTHNRIITSFYTRHHLYRDLAYRQCSRKDFCNFLVGHYTHDAKREGVKAVKHKHLCLVFVKTYVLNLIQAIPSLHDMMSARYIGHQVVIERTLNAVERCLQTREDMWFGYGARWDRFERTYYAYVERPERFLSKRRMTLEGDDGNEIDINDAHRSQNAKRRTLEPHEDCPFIFKRHKAPAKVPKASSASKAVTNIHSKQLSLRNALQKHMRGFICGCIRFLLDQLALTERWGPTFECRIYDQDHLDCDFDWFGRRGAKISIRQVLEKVRAGTMTCDAAALCVTVTQDYLVRHYLDVTEQQMLPQYAASRMTGRCKQLITSRIMRDMRVRFPHTQHEPARNVSDMMLVSIYCSTSDRAPEGLFTDHRSLTYPLHSRALLFHNKEHAPRCQCYHCNPSLPPAMKFSTHSLYRQLQSQVSTGALWSITMSAPSMDLCESIIERVYDNNLELMYRAPTTSFVDNVVLSMNVARENSRLNERLVKAAARITESERRLIATCVERTNPWDTVQYEWFGEILEMQESPLQTLRNAEHMFATHTYPIDVFTTIRDMPLRYPREFLLLEQLFTETYWRRMVQVYRLPLEWTRQQVYSAHERHALVPRGQPLPLKMFQAYYCPHHGEVKRHIARNESWITASVGCTTAVGLDPLTNKMYCTTGFKRGVARANGAQHKWRTANDQMCGGNATENASSSLPTFSSASSSSAPSSSLLDDSTIIGNSSNNVVNNESVLSSLPESWNVLEGDDAEDMPVNCAADVFMNTVSSVSNKESADKKKKKKPRKTPSKKGRSGNVRSSKESDGGKNLDESNPDALYESLNGHDSSGDDEDEISDSEMADLLDLNADENNLEDPLTLPSSSNDSATTSTRRADRQYQLKNLVRRNRGRGPSEFSYQRHHQECLARQHALLQTDSDNWDTDGVPLSKVRQHRYRTAFHRSQDARCSAPLESVCMLGHALVLYGATFLACPNCNTTFRLQWSSFSDAHYLPLCGLCKVSKQQEQIQFISDRVRAPCHCCNPNVNPQKPEQTMRHLVLDDTVPGVHYWRYIHLCSEHNRDYIGDCVTNNRLSNLELYIDHRMRYIHLENSYADGRPAFLMVRDNRTNHSHPFVRGGFSARPDALTSAMNMASTATNSGPSTS
jgi:hypothetical protein